MKPTIKHFTLAAGIIVALLAALMFLMNGSFSLGSSQSVSLPAFVPADAIPVFIEQVSGLVFQVTE